MRYKHIRKSHILQDAPVIWPCSFLLKACLAQR